MPRLSVSRIVRRAVLLHAVAAPGLVACGGETSSSPPDSGVSADAGSAIVDAAKCNVALDGGPLCTLVPCLPPVGMPYPSCYGLTFSLYGTAAECGADEAGVVSTAICGTLCPVAPSGSGASTGKPADGCTIVGRGLSCTYGGPLCGVEGRRPRGLRRCRSRANGDVVAGYLAHMAHLEAASIPAFERLTLELHAHGAPARLQRAARRAMSDEARHAETVTALARRAGATVPRPRVRRWRVRSLKAMASENMVEGCVNETFGAAVAMAQAMTASDPKVRAAMRRIARDEMQHAELAWGVARWLDTRLDPAARSRIARARRRAAAALWRSTSAAVDPQLVHRLGVPGARAARGIVADLRSALWD